MGEVFERSTCNRTTGAGAPPELAMIQTLSLAWVHSPFLLRQLTQNLFYCHGCEQGAYRSGSTESTATSGEPPDLVKVRARFGSLPQRLRDAEVHRASGALTESR